MATRSAIGLKLPDGTISAIYCHWDGYLSGVGRVLENSYQDAEKIKQLLELKELISLGSTISSCSPFKNARSMRAFRSEQEFVCHCCDNWFVEYVYLFKEGRWFYADWESRSLHKL